MRKILTILFISISFFAFGQTSPSVQTDAEPVRGFKDYKDSILIELAKVRTTFSGTGTLRIVVRDSTNNVIYNSYAVNSLPFFINNGTSQQTGASFNIDGSGTIATNLRVNGQIAINSAPSGSYGIYLINKDYYMQGSVSDNSAIISDWRANNGGQRMALRGDGLLFLSYSTAPTQQSSTNLYLNRMFLGNDDAGYLTMTRYNSGTPYAYFQAVQSASTAGTAGFQFNTTSSGSNVRSFQIEANGTVQLSQYGAGALTTDASGNIVATSDIRRKTNIQYSRTGLNAVMNIHPINYRWKDDTGLDTKNIYTGFSAQNIRDFIPNGTGRMANGDLTLQDRAIMAAMVIAIQEQQKEIEELKAIIKRK